MTSLLLEEKSNGDLATPIPCHHTVDEYAARKESEEEGNNQSN